MVQRGVDISVLEVMGHETIETTQRYVHHKTEAKRAALEVLSRYSPEDNVGEVRKLLKC